MSNLQIRITHDDWSYVKSLIDDYITISTKALTFYHTKAERNHYHIYLFDIATQPQSVRKKLKNYFKGNSAFSVSTTCGKQKNKITEQGAYIYGTTIDLIPPHFTKGFSEQQLFTLEAIALEFYKKLKAKEETALEITVLKTHEVLIRSDHTWERLLGLITMDKEKFKNYTIKKFKQWIIADYLNRAKPIPRMADLNRYAYSLFYVKDGKEYFPEHISILQF